MKQILGMVDAIIEASKKASDIIGENMEHVPYFHGYYRKGAANGFHSELPYIPNKSIELMGCSPAVWC